MSVTAVKEDYDSRTNDLTLVLPPGRIDRTYERKFKVYTNSDLDEGSTIYNASSGGTSIPAIGAVYPSDVNAICNHKKCTFGGALNGGGKIWIVTVSYQSHFDFDPASMNEDPLSRPPIYTITYQTGERAVRIDLDGDDIVNSASTPFLPPLSLSYGMPQIEVVWNAATLTYTDLTDNMDCANDATWNGLAASTVLIKGLSYNQKWENNVLYWEKKATLLVRSLDIEPLGWQFTSLLDQGFYEADPVTGDQKLIRDKFGAPLPEPTLLKDGVKKLAADPPQYIPFKTRRLVSFSTLIP